jgi:hypothetical protein
MSGLRRAAAWLGLAFLASAIAGVTLAGPARASSAAAGREAGDPPVTSAQDVMSALHVNANPKTELVFLVDLSDSMRPPQGLYPYVQQQLPQYLATLAQEKSNDQVAVVVFGNPGTARTIYAGPPTPAINLPASAGLGQTDFGQAFNEAINLLSQAAQKNGVQVGGVVLLSDGGMGATNDPVYDGGKGYNAPGWAQLRERAAGLPIPVTGYGVPLTTNPSYIRDQETALSKVFGTNVQTLPGGTSNLAGELAIAGQRVIYGEVTSAVAQDSGRGVQVSWTGLPGTADTPLNLTASGRRSIEITLTSLTSKVPLYVTDLHINSPDGPITAASALPRTVPLAPGKSATFPVTLTWPAKTVGSAFTGGTRQIPGQLQLAGTVSSSWTPALQASFDDLSFSPGALSGEVVHFQVNAMAASDLLFLVIPLIIVAIVGLVILRQMQLFGTLTLTTVDMESGSVPLRGSPVRRVATQPLIGLPGWMLVSGRPFSRRMTIRLQLAGTPRAKVPLSRGGRTMAAGVDIWHRTRSGVPDPVPPRYRRR